MSDGSGFRDSANEDPHGTREAFFALSPTAREQLARPLSGSARRAAVFAWRGPSRIREADGVLEVTDPRGRVHRHPWHQVTNLEATVSAATVVTRVDGRSQKHKVPYVIGDGELPPSGVTLFQRPTLQWWAGLVVGYAALGFSLTRFFEMREVLPGVIGSMVSQVLLNTWRSRKPSVRATEEGLAVGGDIVPWARISGAAPDKKARFRIAPGVRVYLEDGPDLELTVNDTEATVSTVATYKQRATRAKRSAGR